MNDPNKQQPNETNTTPSQSSAIPTETLSPPLYDLCFLSPPKFASSATRPSLTPPPHSEKIVRSIKAAQKELDRHVEEVNRYIEETDEDGGRIGSGSNGIYSPSECSEVYTPPVPDFRTCRMRESYGRRILYEGNDKTSNCSTENDSGDESGEESVMLVKMNSSKRRVIDEDSVENDLDSVASQADDAKCDDAISDEEKSSDVVGAFSELALKDHVDLSEHIFSKSAAQQASLEAVGIHDSEERVVHISESKRRVIDDEESSVESAIFSKVSYVDDASNSDDHSQNGDLANTESLVDNAFSELILNDDGNEEISGNGSRDNDNQIDTHAINDDDSQSNNGQDDDDSILEIEGCGCWTYDKPTGDLYLPVSSGKWPRIRLPFSTYQKLYQHQRIGIQWMASLHRNAIKGGVLADDMGMGKTMQTIVYLGSMMRAESIHNALIVCPKSVVRGWEREANLVFKDIVPKCTVCAVTSDVGKGKRMQLFTEAFCSSFRRPHLIVTTYGLVSSHITELNNIANSYPEWSWNYVILDEGHCIKNPSTNISKHVRILCRNKKTRRLLLTGTPIQNNLRELHSLFDWATSGQLLGSSRTFLNKFAIPIEEGRQKNASNTEIKKAAEVNQSLQAVLQPYFLQRLKSTSFQDKLPTKKELVIFVSLSKKQRKLYQRYLDGGMIKSVLSGEMASPLTAIAHLKQLCGHPSLVRDHASADDRDISALIGESAKLEVLFELVQRLKRAGHRSLIFSQSTKMLDIIGKVFDGSISFLRIDGQTAEKFRQRNVDHFNDLSSGIDCMLLSTKAAGVGLTLNGANRAIIYDPSWNPAEDMQAIDRCYRIGQTRNVTVYRFITAGTVEEKMYEKQVHKDGIRRVLLTESIGGSTERYFDQAELRDLFKLAPPDAPCSMLTKFNGQSASGSSGKQSFLSTHPSVVGVASHDLLYNNARDNTSSTVDLTSSTTKTPFSRQPFKNNESSVDDNVDCILVNESPKFKSLGSGLSRTRQNREDAKARRTEKAPKERASATGSENFTVASVMSRCEVLISKNEYAHAMNMLLGLLESENHLIQGDTKLTVHENVSFLANKLGWL